MSVVEIGKASREDHVKIGHEALRVVSGTMAQLYAIAYSSPGKRLRLDQGMIDQMATTMVLMLLQMNGLKEEQVMEIMGGPGKG